MPTNEDTVNVERRRLNLALPRTVVVQVAALLLLAACGLSNAEETTRGDVRLGDDQESTGTPVPARFWPPLVIRDYKTLLSPEDLPSDYRHNVYSTDAPGRRSGSSGMGISDPPDEPYGSDYYRKVAYAFAHRSLSRQDASRRFGEETIQGLTRWIGRCFRTLIQSQALDWGPSSAIHLTPRVLAIQVDETLLKKWAAQVPGAEQFGRLSNVGDAELEKMFVNYGVISVVLNAEPWVVLPGWVLLTLEPDANIFAAVREFPSLSSVRDSRLVRRRIAMGPQGTIYNGDHDVILSQGKLLIRVAYAGSRDLSHQPEPTVRYYECRRDFTCVELPAERALERPEARVHCAEFTKDFQPPPYPADLDAVHPFNPWRGGCWPEDSSKGR